MVRKEWWQGFPAVAATVEGSWWHYTSIQEAEGRAKAGSRL